MWSLGIVLYEMITYKHPFEATSLPALLHKIVVADPPPIPSTYRFVKGIPYHTAVNKQVVFCIYCTTISCQPPLSNHIVVRRWSVFLFVVYFPTDES